MILPWRNRMVNKKDGLAILKATEKAFHTKSSAFGDDAQERKDCPVYSGFIKYFPLAIAEVARLSKEGNDQHNPGKPLHWDRSKSGDEKDAMMRHIIDEDWVHVAWRAMANLQKELEKK